MPDEALVRRVAERISSRASRPTSRNRVFPILITNEKMLHSVARAAIEEVESDKQEGDAMAKEIGF